MTSMSFMPEMNSGLSSSRLAFKMAADRSLFKLHQIMRERIWRSVYGTTSVVCHRRNENQNTDNIKMYGKIQIVSIDAFVCGYMPQILAFSSSLITPKFSIHNFFKIKSRVLF